MQISPEVMHEQVGTIAKQQREIGYESVFIEGEKDSMTYMKGLFDDWQAKGITSVLHEKKGGYANNTASIYGLAKKAENEGARLLTGVKVTGFKKDNAGAIKTVVTDKGNIDCDFVVVASGPWVKQIWDMLELPAAIGVKGAMASCTKTCRCGPSGRSRRERSASTRSFSAPMTARCRR
jgi:glycine/D-amino acid oxidase-like deaminating enzyme